MFLVDTNILSAIVSPNLPPPINAWMAGTPQRFIYTATICQAEMLGGIAVLPDGRRRRQLAIAARTMFDDYFASRIWPFDVDAAEAYAEIFAARRRGGRHVEPPDLMIAAIALARGASVVTRNVSDFDGCGVTVIDPWNED
jgi:predicted nucleic acid-binding protein